MDVIAAGIFTSSGGTSERAGLMNSCRGLMNCYITREDYHAIADEEPF
jgi:hypothetical protein